MTLQAQIGPELPFLRRYARAIAGSQQRGDAAVRSMLEALLAAPENFDQSRPARPELYRIFHHSLTNDVAHAAPVDGVAHALSARAQQALLLCAVEGFSVAEAATILDTTPGIVATEIDEARAIIAEQLRSNVLIIEDEAVIAMHIAAIVKDIGHSVAAIARTRDEAVDMARAHRPELVLADISLADGSSGIDAVTDILTAMDVPVIFVTAFPERLLTGLRPEPTYLLSKPFDPTMLTATIAQALIQHRARISNTADAA